MATKNIFLERRGSFHDDAFFSDCWNEWDQAMKDAVERWERHIGDSSRILTSRAAHPSETTSVYRQIRSNNVTSDESMAVSYTEEEDKYKLVMDVKDFRPNEISVRALDTTVIIEGKIEKKDGSNISTQTFIKRFHLPPSVNMSSVSSALSKDGILTINAPKFILPKSFQGPQRNIPILGGETTTARVMGSGYPGGKKIVYYGDAAGKPSDLDSGPFNPMGGTGISHYSKDKAYGPNIVKETITLREGDAAKNWNDMNNMVDSSQHEMENMMRNNTIDSSVKPPHIGKCPPGISYVPAGSLSKREVSQNGNTFTERRENRWNDHPAPGSSRDNQMYSESSQIRDNEGNIIGNKLKKEQESKAHGEREEVLSDGTRRKVLTKSYETKQSYQAATSH